MTIRSVVFLAIAAALSGCASMAPSGQTASVQSAVYVVSDATSAIPISDGAAVKSDGKPTSAVPVVAKDTRIYWFLGGR